MTYHVISFDLSTSHVMSHMIDPDIRHPTPAFPLWNTDTITGLRRLPNWDVGSTSYLGNTPVQKLQNSNDWKTQWPDHDIRTSFLFQDDFDSQRHERKKPIQRLVYSLLAQNWGYHPRSLKQSQMSVQHNPWTKRQRTRWIYGKHMTLAQQSRDRSTLHGLLHQT